MNINSYGDQIENLKNKLPELDRDLNNIES
jgi:hypothetical protein